MRLIDGSTQSYRKAYLAKDSHAPIRHSLRTGCGFQPARLRVDRLRQPGGRAFPSRTLPIQGRHNTPPLPPLMPLSVTDAAPPHTVTPTLRLLATCGYALCHARCPRRG